MNNRASFLIVALWAVALFTTMTVSLVFLAGQEIAVMKRELADLESKSDFISSLNLLIELISEDPDPHQDSRAKSWYGKVDLNHALDQRLQVAAKDEESKFNLNYASRPQLDALFDEIESQNGALRGQRKDYVNAILKLRFAGRIESLEELLLMDGFYKEDLIALEPYLTVYTEKPQINLNTADPLVLRALVRSLSGDHSAKMILITRLEEACEAGACNFSNHDLRPAYFSEKLKLPRTPLMTQVVQTFLNKVTLDSDTFHIMLTHINGARASSVFRYRVGQVRPEIFTWHEAL